MRKVSLLVLTVGAVAIAGCGGGGGGGGADSPLDNALRYLPADAPFVVAIDTDTDGEQFDAAGDLSDRVPFGAEVEKRLRELVEERAGDFEDVRKALGNEFVVGSTDARSFVDSPGDDDEAFVGAIEVRDQGALDDLISGDKAKEDGEVDGAKVYEDDSGDPFAIDGDTLVVAGSRQELEAALARRDGDDSLTEEDFDAGTEGVSAGALARIHLNVGRLLRVDSAADALKSKWVRAVRTAGIALTFEEGEIAVDLDVATDSAGLTDADLPIAAGENAPQVLDRPGGIDLALRDPSQVLEFAQATAKAIGPKGFASFERDKAKIERELDVDLDSDLIDELDGDLAVSVGLDGKFGARAELGDPAAFRKTLAKLEDVLPNVAEGAAGEKVGFVEPKPGEDFYAIATSSGDQVVFGVVGDAFVLSNDAAIAGALAKAKTEAVRGAAGALVLSADAAEIAKGALERIEGTDLGDRFEKATKGKLDTGPLDRLTGSIEASTDGLSGSFTVTIDDAGK